MKTLFFLLSVGGGIAWWRYTSVPSISVKLVDWLAKKATVVVRGKEVVIDAALIFRTGSSLISPISFNKYQLSASKNQNYIGAPNVLRVVIKEGDTIIGQAIYVDFDLRTIEGSEKK